MKICLISNLYPPYNRGGAEQVVKNTVSGLISLGHEVVVVTACPAGKNSSDSVGVNPRVYRFFPWNLFFYGNDFHYPAAVRFFWHLLDIFNLHSFFKVRAILQKEKPIVVHTHNLKGLGFLIPLAIRSLGLRHVHTLHDVQLVEPSGIIIKGQEKSWRYNGPWVKLYAAICRRLFGSPQVVISPSKFLLGFYEQRGFFVQSKKVILPNPVVEARDSSACPALGGASLGMTDSNQPFRFLYLGQIEAHKGVLFLIKAFQKMVKELGPGQAEFIIVGTGSRLTEAQSLSSGIPEIIFLGRAERNQLPAIFAKTDVTIAPSLCYENSPTVIFESFSFGVPVLASSIEGVAELIRNEENGWTFEAGNEADLAQKMRWCVQNRAKISALRPLTRRSIEGLDLDRYLDKLLDLCYTAELSKLA